MIGAFRLNTLSALIQQAIVSGAWNISTAVSLGSRTKKYSIIAAETSPQGIQFSSDGTKMYIIGLNNDTVYQYSLSTAWDVNTASYVKAFSASNQESLATCVFFKSDGTSMYVLGTTNDTVYQYNLSTAWDVGTASNANKSFSVATQEITPQGLFFRNNGLTMYIVGSTNDTVYQYTLSTAWDVSTASYASKSFSVATQENAPIDLFFKSDGTTMYIVGQTNDTVYQYTLSTAWDVSTASYASKSLAIGYLHPSVTCMFIGNNGSNLYVLGTTGGRNVYQFSLSTAWDITTSPSQGTGYFKVSQGNADSANSEVQFSSDGTKMYVIGTFNDILYQYTLSTAWDVSTATYANKSLSLSARDTTPAKIKFRTDGTRLYVMGQTNDTVFQYNLSTAWDIATATYPTLSFSVTTQDTTPQDIFFKPDGTAMYVLGTTNDTVYQYNLSTAWAINTASYASKSFSVTTQDTNPISIFFKSDGTKMYILGQTNDCIFQYSLSTAWDISTASYETILFDLNYLDDNPRGFYIRDDGLKLYIVSGTSQLGGTETVYEFNLG